MNYPEIPDSSNDSQETSFELVHFLHKFGEQFLSHFSVIKDSSITQYLLHQTLKLS